VTWGHDAGNATMAFGLQRHAIEGARRVVAKRARNIGGLHKKPGKKDRKGGQPVGMGVRENGGSLTAGRERKAF